MAADAVIEKSRTAWAWRHPAVGLGLAFALLVLAPLPGLRDLLEAPIPAGLDPVIVLVVISVFAAGLGALTMPVNREPLLILAIGLNFELLVIAWFRTEASASGGSLALIGHPAAVVLAGFLAAQLVAPEKARATIALGLALGLGIVALSVFADAVGLYNPPVPELSGPLLVKPNGGLMLQGNEAAALLAVFVLPAVVLLRAVRRPRLAVIVFVLCVAAIPVTRSREAVVVLLVAGAAFLLLTRKIGFRTLVFAAAAVIGIAAAIALPHFLDHPAASLTSWSSGRTNIWKQAFVYLGHSPHWLIGGGLNDFETFVQHTWLGLPWTTHNEPLRLLVDGGPLMFLGYVLLIVVLWRLASRTEQHVGVALKITLVSIIVLGLFKDAGVFTRGVAWLWPLAALAVLHARSPAEAGERAAATKRIAVPALIAGERPR